MHHPVRGGVRGGKDQFKWDDVKADKYRENYLGHSLMAPVGRWQKGKDLHWYARDAKDSAADADAMRDELKRVKEEEESLMAEALGLAPKKDRGPKLGGANLDKHESEQLFKRGKTTEQVKPEYAEGERIQGLGFAPAPFHVANKGASKALEGSRKADKEAQGLDEGRAATHTKGKEAAKQEINSLKSKQEGEEDREEGAGGGEEGEKARRPRKSHQQKKQEKLERMERLKGKVKVGKRDLKRQRREERTARKRARRAERRALEEANQSSETSSSEDEKSDKLKERDEKEATVRMGEAGERELGTSSEREGTESMRDRDRESDRVSRRKRDIGTEDCREKDRGTERRRSEEKEPTRRSEGTESRQERHRERRREAGRTEKGVSESGRKRSREVDGRPKMKRHDSEDD